MVLPLKTPENTDDAMKRLKLFSEHVFNYFINLVVMYGVHLDHESVGVDCSPIVIADTMIKCPAFTLNTVSRRLRKLAEMFGVNIIPNRRTITDLGNAIRAVNVTSPTAEVLIDASRQIFLSYERILMKVKDNELLAYAKEAAEKILKFYVNPSTDPPFTFTGQMITAAVTSDITDDRNIVQCCFGDLFSLFFKFQTDTTKNKLARKFSKAGIYCDQKIYTKDGLNVKKYYYRRLYDNESTDTIQEYHHPDGNPPDEYKFVLFAENKDQQMNYLREHFKSRNVSNLNNELEVIQQKILDEIKSVISIYHLKHLEKVKDSLDAIKTNIKHPSSISTPSTENATPGCSSGMIKTTMESNRIGKFQQKIGGGRRQIETNVHRNKITEIGQTIEGNK